MLISLAQCGSPAFLINCDSHNLVAKEHCVGSIDLQHKSVKYLREFSLFFCKAGHNSVVFIQGGIIHRT